MIPDSTNPRVLADNIRALEKKIGSGGGSDLPDIGPSDYGSYLAVDEEGKWGLDRPEGGLPAVDTSNVGQILTVDRSGNWTAQAGPKIVFVPSKIDALEKLVLDGITYEELYALENAHNNGDLVFCVYFPERGSRFSGYYFAKGTFRGSPYWHEPVRFVRLSDYGVDYLDWDIFDGSYSYGNLPLPKDYSTNEVETGLKWTDGKDIYKKTFSGSFSNSKMSVDVSNVGIEKVVNIEGIYTDGSSFYGANEAVTSSVYNYAHVAMIANVLTLDCYCNISGVNTANVTLYYTKETTTETKKATKKKTTTKGEN